jgi:cytochrome b pre-mRNA-processing protein 3
MIAAVLSLVLLRLEQADLRHESVWLTELFVDDMEAQLRQIGIGDVVVGKHIGRMVSALGGRLSAYKEGLALGGDMNAALRRNLYRGEPVADEAVADVEARLRAFSDALSLWPAASLLAGELPA